MTSIEWTDKTWNPVRGCSRVSAGCSHCYAEGVARRFAGPGQPYDGLVRIGKDGRPKAQWNGTVRVIDDHIADPLRWSKPRMVFVNSMSDIFHESLDAQQIARVFAVMGLAHHHRFQVLTKRAHRMGTVLSNPRFWHSVVSAAEEMTRVHPMPEAIRAIVSSPWAGFDEWAIETIESHSLPNVWLGASVEDQSSADERIPALLSAPASVRWVSYEPALGPVDFSRVKVPDAPSPPSHATVLHAFRGFGSRLDWIVVGGESGPGARPFDVAWARSTVAACREAGVPCFVKQLGSYPVVLNPMDPTSFVPASLTHRKGGDPSEWPEDLRVREWPEVTRG